MKNFLTILFVFLLVQNASLVFGHEQSINNDSLKYASELASPHYADSNGVYKIVDQQPEPGYNLTAYLNENLHYPKRARKHNIQGRVIVRFIVNEDGSISDLKVMKSVDEDLTNEALRVIKNMPKWDPGKDRGKPVKVYFTQPITFKMEK